MKPIRFIWFAGILLVLSLTSLLLISTQEVFRFGMNREFDITMSRDTEYLLMVKDDYYLYNLDITNENHVTFIHYNFLFSDSGDDVIVYELQAIHENEQQYATLEQLEDAAPLAFQGHDAIGSITFEKGTTSLFIGPAMGIDTSDIASFDFLLLPRLLIDYMVILIFTSIGSIGSLTTFIILSYKSKGVK